MTSIRLPEVQEKFIEKIAVLEHKTKSDIVKEAISEYLKKYDLLQTPYELGRESFGKAGSGKGFLSKEYKSLLKEKLNAKYTH